MSALLFSAFVWFLLAALLAVFVYVLAITLRFLLSPPRRREARSEARR